MIRLTFVAAFMAGTCLMPAGCATSNSAVDMHMQAYQQRTALVEEPAPVACQPTVSPASWLQMGALLATQPVDETVAATGGQAFVPWQQRRGPAYPNDMLHSAGRDMKELPLTLWDDTRYAAKDPVFWAGMITAGVAGIVINGTGVDDAVDRRTDGNRQLSKTADGIGGFFGSPAQHAWMTGLWYLGSLALETRGHSSPAVTKSYETSKTMANALIINGVITSVLKAAAHTESPNGDENGWPSGHASSSFTVATVMYHAYGPYVGVPLFAFAGFVGYERIDARNHDFSDVISGMLIGMAVGHVVSVNHDRQIFGMTLIPYADPQQGAFGLALGKRW